MTFFDTAGRDKIEAQLVGEVMRTARRKAEALAARMGHKLGPAGGVSNGDLKNPTRAMGLAAADYSGRGQSRAGWSREGGVMILPLRLAQPVDLIYRIK